MLSVVYLASQKAQKASSYLLSVYLFYEAEYIGKAPLVDNTRCCKNY